jgi:ribonuclease P protein component
MKKINRIRKSGDFKKTIEGSKSARTEAFVIYLKPNSLGYLRIGISTSKKLGGAVVRVKVRRQIRAFFAVYNMYKKSYDIVIAARPGFLTRKSSENRDELLKKLNSLMIKGETQREEGK